MNKKITAGIFIAFAMWGSFANSTMESRDTIAIWMNKFNDKDPYVKAEAIWFLVKRQVDSIIPDLIIALQDPREIILTSAKNGLMNFGSKSTHYLQKYLDGYVKMRMTPKYRYHKAEKTTIDAVEILDYINDEQSIKCLINTLQCPDFDNLIINILIRKVKKVLPVLERDIQSKDPAVRIKAINTLCQIPTSPTTLLLLNLANTEKDKKILSHIHESIFCMFSSITNTDIGDTIADSITPAMVRTCLKVYAALDVHKNSFIPDLFIKIHPRLSNTDLDKEVENQIVKYYENRIMTHYNNGPKTVRVNTYGDALVDENGKITTIFTPGSHEYVKSTIGKKGVWTSPGRTYFDHEARTNVVVGTTEKENPEHSDFFSSVLTKNLKNRFLDNYKIQANVSLLIDDSKTYSLEILGRMIEEDTLPDAFAAVILAAVMKKSSQLHPEYLGKFLLSCLNYGQVSTSNAAALFLGKKQYRQLLPDLQKSSCNDNPIVKNAALKAIELQASNAYPAHKP